MCGGGSLCWPVYGEEKVFVGRFMVRRKSLLGRFMVGDGSVGLICGMDIRLALAIVEVMKEGSFLGRFYAWEGRWWLGCFVGWESPEAFEQVFRRLE